MQRSVALENDESDVAVQTGFKLVAEPIQAASTASDTSSLSHPNSKKIQKKQKFPFKDDIDLSTISDVDLVRLATERLAPTLSWTEEKHVMRISQKLVLKYGKGVLESEAKMLQLIERKKLDIKYPRIHRASTLDEDKSHWGTCGYIVMDYIEGERLDDNWVFFPRREQERIIEQVADAVRQLQSVYIHTPGPIGGGPYRGRFFSNPGVAAFQSASEMESWFEQRLSVSKRFHQCPQDLPVNFKFDKFVLVHQHLVPENLMVDLDGNVWIVGWSNAGAYPPAFERAAIAASDGCEEYRKAILEVLPERKVEEKQLEGLRFALDVANYG
ncbi:hypothetical protein KEM54_004325 [Ascosphaera aggregata]|nr:hypothetical protein KEM54_004325 [Ascosphaera aggregata]